MSSRFQAGSFANEASETNQSGRSNAVPSRPLMRGGSADQLIHLTELSLKAPVRRNDTVSAMALAEIKRVL